MLIISYNLKFINKVLSINILEFGLIYIHSICIYHIIKYLIIITKQDLL